MKVGAYDVKVRVNSNCRRMILRCRPQEGTVLLTVPRGTTEAAARAFLTEHMDWLREHMGTQEAWRPQYAPGERHWCLGRLVTLGTEAPAGRETFLRWRNEKLLAVLRRQLQTWAARMGVRISHVTLQEMSSRWGSCRAATGRLTFNTRLGLLEESLIEETVVHELCHFFHQNHSKAFYDLMSRWLPDWKMRKQRRDKADMRPRPPMAG